MISPTRTLLSLSIVALAACGGATGAITTLPHGQPAVAPVDTTDDSSSFEGGRLATPATEAAEVAQPASVVAAPDAETPPPPASGERAQPPVAGGCSATPVEPVAQQLPAAVEQMRGFLSEAAGRCDEQALQTAATESSRFTYAFGEEGDFIGHLWRVEGHGTPAFRYLAELLQTTPALADGGGAYVWPRVLTGRAEDTTGEAWAELVPIFGQQEVDRLRDSGAGGYLGWRVGISTDGELRFFVTGD